MSLETLTIEIRTDFEDPAKDKLAIELVRSHTKAMLSSLMLLQDKRPPQISLMHSNMFEREKEINLADDIPEELNATLTQGGN